MLGPLQVEDDDGKPVTGLPPRQRQLLARLIASAGRPVSSSVLREEFWPDPTSAGAGASLHAQISRLRSRLGDAVRIENGSLGYRLVLDGHSCDAVELQRIVSGAGQARSHGRHGDAADRLVEALALFRGDAYVDIADTDLGRAEGRRLAELRHAVWRDLIEALLDDGRTSEALEALHRAIDEAPYDERLWSAKMLALHRLGRSADALTAYQMARVALGDELGLEPGLALRDLEHRILDHDPTLLDVRGAARSLPPLSYAHNGAVHLAYRVLGDGPVDVVWVPDYLSHLDLVWEHPPYRAFLGRLATFGRLVTYDKRGQGLSDRTTATPPIEDRVADLVAVLDAVGSTSAFLIGSSEGAAITAFTAAEHPDRVAGLVAFGVSLPDRDGVGPGPGLDDYVEWIKYLASKWGTGRSLRSLAPSVAEDPAAVEWYGRLERQTIDPGSIVAYAQDNARSDFVRVEQCLASITAPALVLQRRDEAAPIAGARRFAGLLARSRFVELDGCDHLIWYGNTQDVLDEIERFIVEQSPLVSEAHATA